jgi:hypothetical protein
MKCLIPKAKSSLFCGLAGINVNKRIKILVVSALKNIERWFSAKERKGAVSSAR